MVKAYVSNLGEIMLCFFFCFMICTTQMISDNFFVVINNLLFLHRDFIINFRGNQLLTKKIYEKTFNFAFPILLILLSR
jgi:hypothetical protein